MEFLLIALPVGLFLLLIAAIVGLIRPSLVKQETRGKAFLANFIPAAVIFVMIGIFAPEESESPAIGAEESPGETTTSNQTESIASSRAEDNIKLVVSSLNDNYGIEAQYSIGEKYRFNDNYCEAMADTIKIQTMGYIAEALPSSKASPSFYQSICSAIFIGLSGANKELAEQTTIQAFNFAAQNGRAESSVAGVDIEIRPMSDSLLACKYVKP